MIYSFRPFHGPGVDSAPSVNEYQEHFLGVKAAGAWSWPHHLHVPNDKESGSLNLLEPSGPYRTCYGTALHLPLPLHAKNQRPISDWPITWSSRLTHRLFMAICADWSTDWSSDWLTTCYQWLISVQCRHTNVYFVHTNLGPPKELSHHYALSSLGTPDTVLRNPGVPQNQVWETVLYSM